MKSLCALMLIFLPSMGFAQRHLQWRPLGEARLYIVVQGGGQTPCQVDFEDFIAFAQAFNSTKGQPGYNPHADTNGDGVVNFPDFIAFAGVFGLAFVDSEACLRHQRRLLKMSGQVLQAGKPFENVWIDVLKDGFTQVEEEAKTNALGTFEFFGLNRGVYALVPKRFGYAFSPDTVRTVMGDSSISVAPMVGVLAFGLVDVMVVRNGEPVSGVKVSLLRGVTGQTANGPWVGVTDPSGATAIRIPVLDGESDITGTYIASVTDTTTGDVLGSWTSVPIQTADTRRLVLDFENEVHYIPEREYFFYYRGQQKVSMSVSVERFRIWFRDDVDQRAKEALLKEVDLEDQGDHFFALRDRKGRWAMIEVLHLIKKSSLVQLAIPELDAGRGYVFRTHHLIVAFNDGVSEPEIAQFLNEMGASVIQMSDGEYEVSVSDLLSQDIFEVSEKYRIHPLVKYIQPDYEAKAFIF